VKRLIAAAALLLASASMMACKWGGGANATQAGANVPAAYTETIKFSQIKFDMVHVPGDAAKGIKPFYIGKCEVTWDEFMPWAMCNDVGDEKQTEKLRELKQRPSKPGWPVDRGFGMAGRPALSMSRTSAELYCKWLSEQTGRKYRLPTEKEWEHAFVLGGGDLKKAMSKAEADRVAVWKGNALKNDSNLTMSSPVGSKAADKLGLFDMAGNVAEWVTGTGDKRTIRGGYFDSDLGALGALGREVENNDVWNSNDPGDPKSPWWFHDHVGVGMRVVCEP
jgi:hypothetical protein